MAIPTRNVAVNRLPIPGEFPHDFPLISNSLTARFPELATHNQKAQEWWFRTRQNLLRQVEALEQTVLDLLKEVNELKTQAINQGDQITTIVNASYIPKLQNVRTLKWHRIYIIDRSASGTEIPPRIFADRNPIP